MPRFDDRYYGTRLYVGHLSSRTNSRDLEDIFNRYGRVRDVDMKYDFAFIDFNDSRDADDARHSLNGREIDGSRIIVEFAKGTPRGPGGSREYLGRGPPPGSGRCFNCGIDGHWARDCKSGDWKNKCYRCGERGHIERKCPNSPKSARHGRSYSRSPSPRRGRGRGRSSRSYSRSRSYSPSRSPPRERNMEPDEKRSRSTRYSRSPRKSNPKERKKQSPSPDGNRGPHTKSPQLLDHARSERDGSDHSRSPPRRGSSRSPARCERDSPSPREAVRYGKPDSNGRAISPTDEDECRASPRGSESPRD